MSKYKIGDRVRIVSFMGNDHSPLTGITGTVTDTPGYGTIVNLDHGIRLYGAYSNTVSDLLLILDKELEYEDNGARGFEDLYYDQPSLPVSGDPNFLHANSDT